jgi:molecular chaperone HscB
MEADRSLADDDFALFGLPRRFGLNDAVIDAAWRRWMAGVHPDRHASGSSADQRLAAQWATRINEAYRRLKDPLRRAAYLCELHGNPVAMDGTGGLPRSFLIQQMEWREALDEASTPEDLDRVQCVVAAAHQQHLAALETSIDGPVDSDLAVSWDRVAEEVRILMFFQRFRRDLRDRLDQLDSLPD